MDIFEAIKALGEGKKIKKRDWEDDVYVVMDKHGNFVDEEGCVFGLTNLRDNDWEIVDEREETNQLLKDLYKILDVFLDEDYNQYDVFLYDESLDEYKDANHMEKLFYQLKEMNKYYKLDK
jgi:hypothetical protein